MDIEKNQGGTRKGELRAGGGEVKSRFGVNRASKEVESVSSMKKAIIAQKFESSKDGGGWRKNLLTRPKSGRQTF